MSWLVPAAGPVRDRLAGVIAGLAAEHGTPVFAPHVTINGNVDAEPDAAARVLEQLVAGVPPFEVTLSGPGYEPEYFRSLYLRAEPSVRLTALHQAGQRAWGIEGPPYRGGMGLVVMPFTKGGQTRADPPGRNDHDAGQGAEDRHPPADGRDRRTVQRGQARGGERGG